MNGKSRLQVFPMLLVLLLMSMVVIPVFAYAEERTEISRPVEISDSLTLQSQVLTPQISSDIINATPHWYLLAADAKGQKNALNDLNKCDISDEEKAQMKEYLLKLWAKYPVSKVNNKGDVCVTFNKKCGIVQLTTDEEQMLEKIDKTLAAYLNEKYDGTISVKWVADPCHQDMIEIACLKWGVPSDQATYAHNAADDPDSWPPVTPPTGLSWLDDFINQVCHSYDHYYNPSLGTGNAPLQCKNYANSAKDYYDNSNMQSAFTNLGYSSHFLTDVANPMHTGREVDQALNQWVHSEYESYVWENWESGKNFKEVCNGNWYYYTMSDPEQAVTSLASYSHAKLDDLFYDVYNHRDTFRSDSDVEEITDDCLLEMAKHTLGLVKYVRD